MQSQPQGEMTSARLTMLLRSSVDALLPGVVAPGADKMALLLAVLEHLGPGAVVEIGQAVRHLSGHPVLDALIMGQTPVDVLERWMRLERFGHTRNRTRVVHAGSEPPLIVEHFALDGGWIHPVNDLFIWGVLIALLERAGFVGLEAQLEQPRGDPVSVWVQGQVRALDQLPDATTRLSVSWQPDQRKVPATQAVEESSPVQAAMGGVIRTDLLRTWRLSDVAPMLGVSTRSLQRHLAREGTSFSETLHRTRIDASRELMRDRRLALTDIAFCLGFSDQAHFSRLFHRYLDVPPSAFRELHHAK